MIGSVVRTLQNFDYDWGVLFTAGYLSKEPPHWIGTDFDPDIAKAWHFNFGHDTLAGVQKCFSDLLRGRIPDPITFMGANFNFSMHDPKAAPSGLHSIQLWADVPYAVRQYGGPDKWDEGLTEKVFDKCTDRLEEYAPGFRKNIVDTFAYSPTDVARRNDSAIKGVWSGGIVAPGQCYFDSAFLGLQCSQDADQESVPFKRSLTMSFSWLGSGYNAATVVMEDYEVKKPSWWSGKPLEWIPKWAEDSRCYGELTDKGLRGNSQRGC